MSFSTLARPAGDGMDSEELKYQPYKADISKKAPSRHKNLQLTSSTTTVIKSQHPKYVPHEPVRGAVKATNSNVSMTAGYKLPLQLQNVSGEQTQSAPESMTDRTKASLNALPYPYIAAGQQNIPSFNLLGTSYTNLKQFSEQKQSTGYSHGHPAVSVERKTPRNVVVENIQVPVYHGPSHLHMDTYRTMHKHQQQKKQQSQSIPLPSELQRINTIKETKIDLQMDKKSTSFESVIPMENLPQKSTIINIEEERKVEGGTKSMVEQLNSEIDNLKEELKVHAEVNADLKKMLVASMGDDLHYKVECLVRTKAHLAAEVGGYSEKLYKDYEDLDKLSIQADMWRTKYKATRVLVEQLTTQRGQLARRCEQNQYALQQLLQERQEVKSALIPTYRYLYTLRDALGPRHKAGFIPMPTNVLDLARGNEKMADSVRFGLLGSITIGHTPVDNYVNTLQSPAEQLALQIVNQQADDDIVTVAAPTASELPKTAKQTFSRWHPNTRSDDLTFNCCPKCKGDIKII